MLEWEHCYIRRQQTKVMINNAKAKCGKMRACCLGLILIRHLKKEEKTLMKFVSKIK